MSGDLVTGDIPEDLPAIEQEIGEIEGLMRTNRTAYNRDEAKQARLRGLYNARGQVQSLISPDDTGSDLMAIVSRAEFERQVPDGDYGLYLRYMRHAADVTNAVPASERAAFIESYERLPQGVQISTVIELLNKRTAMPEPVDEAGVRKASSGYPGASIVREWGADASRNIGIVRARLWRLIDSLPSDDDVAPFLTWLGGLSEGQAKAVYRKLAA